MKSSTQRVVFFDLDGTLHQQDMFGSFLRYVLRHQPLNLLLVVPLLPVILAGLAVNGRAAPRGRFCPLVSPARDGLSGGAGPVVGLPDPARC